MRSNIYPVVHHNIRCNYNNLLSLLNINCNFSTATVNKAKKRSMPRSMHDLTIQRARQKIMEKSEKFPASGKVALQILGTGARGAPKCIYLTTDHSRYMFNCGEGTQRLAHEHKCRLIKLKHIFVTSATWDKIGGMPGLFLTLQDIGLPKLTVHGPKGITGMYDTIKNFVLLQNLKINEVECDQLKPYTDQIMTVSYVPIVKSNTNETEVTDMTEEIVDNINYYNYLANSNGKRIPDGKEEKNNEQTTGKKSDKKRITSVMCYICKLHPRAGMLSLEKCADKGVKPGPQLGQLKAGQDIVLPDGTVVLSKDVCSPPILGPTILVVECPSEDYLESFVNHPDFAKLQTTTSNECDAPYCIVHFTPQKVIDTPRYTKWMKKFDSNTKHIVINEENECMGTEAPHRHQHKLHILHPQIFPLLNEECFQKKTREKDTDLIYRPRTLHTFHLQPKISFEVENEISLHPKEYINEVFEIEGFLDILAQLQTDINARTKLLTLTNNKYPRILMLGTGSSIPSKIRNVSGILLRVDGNHSILLDCGEGTYGQILRFYGRTKIDNIIRTIKAIYISHLHADHHIGLIGLLKERGKITKEPLYLFAPAHITTWLKLYHKCYEPILHQMTLIPNSELFMGLHPPTASHYNSMYRTLNVQAIRTTLIKHCPYAYGVSIVLNNGEKIVYSGDTMPCEDLVKLGQDCDLLIHEATMEDDLIEDAKLKRHSTVSQAIEIGKQMNSKFTLLTHFSQRYSNIPILPENENGTNLDNVGIAYDNMHISLSQLPLLPLMYPALKVMFSKYYVQIEERAAKRQRVTAD